MANRDKRNIPQPACYKQFSEEGRTHDSSHDSEILIKNANDNSINTLSLQHELTMAEVGDNATGTANDIEVTTVRAMVHQSDNSESEGAVGGYETDQQQMMDDVEIHAPTDGEEFDMEEVAAHKTPRRMRRGTGKASCIQKQFEQLLEIRHNTFFHFRPRKSSKRKQRGRHSPATTAIRSTNTRGKAASGGEETKSIESATADFENSQESATRKDKVWKGMGKIRKDRLETQRCRGHCRKI